VVLVTEWDGYRALDLDTLEQAWRHRSWSICATSTGPKSCTAMGFVGVGR
jgi:hypothetical protein